MALGTTLFAQGKGGSVDASGHVTVNGKALHGKGAIFSNEPLETARGNANVVTDGTSTAVDDQTSLTMRDNHLDLDCGRVRVVTLSKFAVHVHDTVVTPLDSGKTTFEVAQGTRKVDIKAMQGKIEIARNKTTSTLLPGQIREIEDEAACRALAAFDWKPIPLWGAGVVPFYFLGGDGDDHQGGGDISPFQP